jgi:hypothetical protein
VLASHCQTLGFIDSSLADDLQEYFKEMQISVVDPQSRRVLFRRLMISSFPPIFFPNPSGNPSDRSGNSSPTFPLFD